MKKPLLYLVRHGSTTDSAKNIFRGQRNASLDKKGFSDAHSLKDFFKKKEWHRIFCSPLARAIQTATIICDDQADYQPEVTPGLESWNIGVMTGKFKTPENKKKMKHFVENPDEAPKDGESRHEFEQRVWPLLAEGIELGWKQNLPCIIVAHSSIVHSLNHLMQGESHEDLAVKPGGVMEVYLEDGEIFHGPVVKASKEDGGELDPTNAS